MKRAYYIGMFIPPELIAAHGFEPRRLQLSAIHENRGVRPGLCPYADALMNRIPSLNGAPIAIAITCDQTRRTIENLLDARDEVSTRPRALSMDAGKPDSPLFAFDVPATHHADAREQYRLELERFGRFLVRCGGREPTLNSPAGRDRRADGANRKTAHLGHEGVPIAIVGGPLLTEHAELFEIIERYGGRVAVDGSEGSERTQPNFNGDLHGCADLLDMLTAAYFDTIPDAFRRPDADLDAWLSLRLKDRSVKGIVFYSYMWCDLWRAKLRHLTAVASLPALCLELGPEVPLHPRTITRVEAFLESLR